jgi:7-cyano-7-deazaguanine synthase
MAKASRKAVVLLSGGLDSMVAAAIARERGFSVLALTVDYNQRHRIELDSAEDIARALGVERHIVLRLDLTQFGGSALTDQIDVPKSGPGADIPITYVPARNTIFLSLCLGWAEAAGARDLFIGVNALDYSGYPDCRPDFIAAFEAMANLGTKAGVEGDGFTIHTPLIDLSKADIVREAARLKLDAGMSWSCYDPAPDRRALRAVRILPAARKGLRRGRAARPDALRRKAGSMSYSVKELFLTLQGEGIQSGSRAVFLRFAGCNLWSGREKDRASAQCTFCDTDFVGTDGTGGGKFATRKRLPRPSKPHGAGRRRTGWS